MHIEFLFIFRSFFWNPYLLYIYLVTEFCSFRSFSVQPQLRGHFCPTFRPKSPCRNLQTAGQRVSFSKMAIFGPSEPRAGWWLRGRVAQIRKIWGLSRPNSPCPRPSTGSGVQTLREARFSKTAKTASRLGAGL